MATGQTFSQVISNAIRDFDNIYDALKTKLVTASGTTPLTAAQRSDGTIATSQYANFITNQLYRVGTATTENGETTMVGITPVLVGGVIASYAGATSSVTDGTYGTLVGDNLPVTLAIASPGYYDTTSRIVGNVPVIGSLSVTGSSIASYAVVNNSVTEYVIKDLTNNYPLMEVHIPQGAVSVTYSNTPTITESITNTLDIDSSSTISNATLNSGNTGDYTLVITKNAQYTGEGTITPEVSTTAGFVTSSQVTVPSPTFSILSNMTEATDTIYIPAATVSGTLSNTADVSLTGSSGISLLPTAPSEGEYYTLTASATGLSVIGTTTAGYLPSGSNIALGSVADKEKSFYLPAGSVPDTTIALTSEQLTYTDSGSALTSTVTNYPITFGITQGSPEVTTIIPGYIQDTSYSVSVSGTKTMYIKQGAITEAANITVGSITGNTDVISVGTSGQYRVTVPISASVSTVGQITQGFISEANQITHNDDTDSVTLSVAAGSATITPTLTVAVTDREDNKDAEVVNEEIFSSEAPETGDYYTITASASKNVTSGYMTDSNVTIGNSNIKYLKKATFQYVQMEDNETSFLQVKTGGYVPSGMIANIADISGSIDNASLTVALGDGSSGILTSSTPESSYYTIIASKGTVNAGYMSSSSGDIDGTAYVLHGSQVLTSTFNSSTIDTTSTPVFDDTNGKYTLAVSHSLTNALTFQEGYTKLADITLNGSAGALTNTISGRTSLDIGEGAYGITSKEFRVTITNTSNVLTSTASGGYALTPAMTAELVIDATTAGYISGTNERVTAEIAASDASITATPIYIKKGAGSIARSGHTADDWSALATNATTSTATLSDNFTSSIDGSYTITLGGYAEAALELDEGYYKASDNSGTTLSGGKVYLNKTMTVSHGHASMSLQTPSNSFTLTTSGDHPEDISSILATNAPATGYIAIQSEVGVTGSISITEGYVKDISADKTEASVSGATTIRYIPTVNLSNSQLAAIGQNYEGNNVASGTTVYGAIRLGSNDGDIHAASTYATASTTETGLRDAVILPTKNKFALYDTKVELTADAMGSAVVAELLSLENRLAGRAATAS